MHLFSDGPCTQYRQKGNFYHFCTKLHQCEFPSGAWNFFEASHGKDAPGGVGGLLKRTADRLVSHGKDIPNAELFFNALDAKLAIKLFYINEDNVAEAVKNLQEGLPVVMLIPGPGLRSVAAGRSLNNSYTLIFLYLIQLQSLRQ